MDVVRNFSWLLKKSDMAVRTTNRDFMEAVENYFFQLLSSLKDLQWRNGNPQPIIAVQVTQLLILKIPI